MIPSRVRSTSSRSLSSVNAFAIVVESNVRRCATSRCAHPGSLSTAATVSAALTRRSSTLPSGLRPPLEPHADRIGRRGISRDRVWRDATPLSCPAPRALERRLRRDACPRRPARPLRPRDGHVAPDRERGEHSANAQCADRSRDVARHESMLMASSSPAWSTSVGRFAGLGCRRGGRRS